MKKHIFDLLTILCVCLVLTVAAAAVSPIGDANGDGEFSLMDVLRILKSIGKAELIADEINCMDVAADGAVTVKDALLLLRYYVSGEKPSFCKIDNLYHEGCLLNDLEIGAYDTLAFSTPEYPDFKIRFKIYIPASYSPHKEYALATHFHGLGGESKDTSQLSGSTWFQNILASEYGEDTVLLLPQCPEDMTWPHDRETIEAVYLLIRDIARHMNIDTDRLYLSGHSYGSMAVSYMIEAHPNTFAAAIMGSGAGTLASYTSLENLATTPIRMFCGDADGYNFHIRFRALYAALLELDADVEYTEFAGLTHNIFGTVGNQPGLVDWVFSQTLAE